MSVQTENTTEIIILVAELSYLLNMMSVLLVPSLAPYDPELHRCTLPSDSSGWSKTQSAVFPPRSLVSLGKTEKYNLKISFKYMFQDLTVHHKTLEGRE